MPPSHLRDHRLSAGVTLSQLITEELAVWLCTTPSVLAELQRPLQQAAAAWLQSAPLQLVPGTHACQWLAALQAMALTMFVLVPVLGMSFCVACPLLYLPFFGM